eukprot:TRINITY_DN3867_c0_g1_i1.p1 TRINITY_DN3867_c0_g1~~TRINITY_DN3867_c0_g1_i1.p1  ORF type:complete len:255 (-),score=22.49 TRINITY_DN3867_c0_g1_i1:193-957(-)
MSAPVKPKLRLGDFYPKKREEKTDGDADLPMVKDAVADPNGDFRGKCEVEACRCRQYTTNPDSDASNQITCIMCGHAPLQHQLCQKGHIYGPEDLLQLTVDPLFITRPPPGQTFHRYRYGKFSIPEQHIKTRACHEAKFSCFCPMWTICYLLTCCDLCCTRSGFSRTYFTFDEQSHQITVAQYSTILPCGGFIFSKSATGSYKDIYMETKCDEQEVVIAFPDNTRIQIEANGGFIKGWVEFLQERRITPSVVSA